MGQKISNPKCRLLVHYYVFQNTIKQYLTDWKDKTDRYRIERGYIIEPDWIKEWKKIINYDYIKTEYLDLFNLVSTNVDDDQKLLINQHLEPNLNDYEEDLIYCPEDENEFLVYEDFLSLEYLQNLCDETIYKLFHNHGKYENVEYIFKQKMIIIFFKVKKMIKIIMFNENKNKIINLKYIYNDINNYKKGVYFFERNNSDKILEKITITDIFNNSSNEYEYKNNNEIIYTLYYEDKNYNLNNINTLGESNVGNMTNKINNITPLSNNNNNISNNNNTPNTSDNNGNNSNNNSNNMNISNSNSNNNNNTNYNYN